MEKENKNINWTAIIIAIVIGVVVLAAIYAAQNNNNQTQTNQTPATTSTQPVTVRPTQTPTNNGVNLSVDCATRAKALFNDKTSILQGSVIQGSVSKPQYKSHYNASLEKCFALIWYSTYSSGIGSEEDLYDVYDNNQIGWLTLGGANGGVLLCKTESTFNCTLSDYSKYIDSKFESKGN